MHLNDSIIPQAEELAARGRKLLSEGKAAESIRVIEELLALDPDDVNVCIIASAQFIDASSVLGDIDLADRGIELIERMLAEWTNPTGDIEIQLRYNLSNGYSSKYKQYRDNGQTEEAEENLQRQKLLLQSILARREHIPDELAPAVITNYANTLDHFNRTFEAIDQFLDCLRLEPGHGLAKGNCSAAIQRVLNITRDHRLSNLQACWQLSSSAVAEPNCILRWSSPEALAYLVEGHSRLRSGIEGWLENGIPELEEFIQHREADHPKEPAPDWIDRVAADRLLLTFNQIPLMSALEMLDDAFFDSLGFGLSREEEAKSIELIHLFNTIKEEFVTARHLYYLAAEQEGDLIARNDVTFYGDPEGDAEFGLISGLLKTSFRSSVELLDKVAVFLAAYFDLEARGRLNFNNVWFENCSAKKGILHPKIEAALKYNFPLKGLRDFQHDFFRQEYPGPIKDTRNAAVHQWLRLSWLPVEKGTAASWNMDDFSELTFFVLRQAKAAILQLAAAVNVEEARRRTSDAYSGKKEIQIPLNIRKPISARAADNVGGPQDLDNR